MTPRARALLLAIGLACLFGYAAWSNAGSEAKAATQEAIVTGLVVDAHGGRPIPGASVLVRNARLPAAYFERANASGNFLVEREGSAGLVEIIASKNGYGIGVKRYRLEEGESLQQLLFQLEPSAELRGRVVDEFSVPVAGAKVEIAYERALSRLGVLDLGTNDIWTAEDGTFRIRNIQPRVGFTIIARDTVSGKTNEAGPVAELLIAGQRREGVVITLADRK